MPFASTNKTYEDGQQSRTPQLPQEIWSHGFTPPVRLPDGRIHAGDVLPASWLNDLMRRFTRAAELLPSAATLANQIPSAGASNGSNGVQSSWGIHCGPLTIEIGTWANNGSRSGTLTLQTPVKAGTNPHLYMLDLSDPASATGKFALWSGPNATQSFTFSGLPFGRSDSTNNVGTFLYLSVLENTVADVPDPLSGFCVNPRTFLDGQTSFTAPTQDQQLYGFAPARTEGSAAVAGDTLPANVLNFLLNDLSGTLGLVGWEIKRNYGGTGMDAYCITMGEMQITSQRQTVPGAPTTDAGIDQAFAFPFGEQATTDNIAMLATGMGTSKPAYAQAYAKNATTFSAGCRDVSAAAGSAPGIANCNMAVLAIGPALASRKRNWLKVTGLLNGFANTNKTYADGQLNKVAPVTDRQTNGFTPNRKVGTKATAGDLVTANELNYLFNQLYAARDKMPVSITLYPAYAATKRRGGGRIVLGKLMIQWELAGAFTPADFSGSLHTHTFTQPFSARSGILPFVFSSVPGTHMNAAAVFTTTDSANGKLSPQNVQTGGINLVDGTLSAYYNAQIISFGEAP